MKGIDEMRMTGLVATPKDFARMMRKLARGEVVRVTTRGPKRQLTRLGAAVGLIDHGDGVVELMLEQVVKRDGEYVWYASKKREFGVKNTDVVTLSRFA